MFRLIKLAVYAVIGYAIYEFVQGIIEENRSDQASAPRRPSRQEATSAQR